MPAQPIPQSPGLLRRLVALLRQSMGLQGELACPKCSTPMVLRQINPDKPGFDSRIFACPRCGQQKTKVFRIRM
jgi:predicted RNA-binding Zn-ribbon protein involved in translation (DUF1610 family)